VKATARDVAAGVVGRVLDHGSWAQPALDAALNESGLDARDRGLCTELVYGTLRWCASLERSLLRSADKPGKGLDKKIRPHLLVAAYQLQHLSERIPAHAAVSEAITNIKRVRPGLDGFSNALLRKLGSSLVDLLPPDAPLDDVAATLGVPPILANAIASQVPPSEMKAALVALNGRPTTYGYALKAGSVAAGGTGVPPVTEREGAHAFVPGIYALDGGAVHALEGFNDGAFVVMDPGSAVCALLLARGPGQRVIDMCAAPGGKTALLASLSEGGKVVAVEKSGKRARLIKETMARTKLTNRVDVVVADALEARVDPADAVLLDAPCTGFGTTRRKPEIKLRRTEADVASDAVLQAQLLERAFALTKPGGVIVYSVCSPIPEEGVEQIDRILSAHAELRIESARDVLPWLPADAVDERGCVHLLTHRHDSDAFFIARLRRS
jgi:16S rRNA (cytosine967-C5)-methyltransferase